MNTLREHIWLCGFMGCGKSTVGRALAKCYCADFIDMDSYIEQQEQITIPQIFAQYGEPRFREMETACIASLKTHTPAVIAAGGGAFVSAENAALAAQSGKVVFLDIPFEICYQRIQHSDRPIVQRSTKEELKSLFELRHKYYMDNATICFREILPPPQAAEKLAALIATSK